MSTRANRFFFAPVLLTAVFTAVQPTRAQDGELPPARPAEPPRERLPDIDQWIESYERDGRPTILVLCGVSDGLIEARGAGKIIWNHDAGGIPSQIATAFESYINPPGGDVELVHLNSLHDAKDRLSGVLTQRDEEEAVKLIMRDLAAERIITIKLSPTDGVTKVVVSCADAARGRGGYGETFDWKGDFSARNIKLTMRDVARSFIDHYARSVRTGLRSLTLRLLGLAADPDGLQTVKDAMNSARGVESVKRRNQSSTAGESVIEYELRYDANADLDDLLLDLQKKLQTSIGAGPVMVVKQEGRAVTLRVEPKADAGKAQEEKAWVQLITAPGSDGDEARDRFTELWKKKNSPKLMVLVNRRPTEEEIRQAPVEGGPAQVGTLVVVSGNGDAGAFGGRNQPDPGPDKKPREEFRQPDHPERIARQLETEVGRLFSPDLLNLTTVQSDVARARLSERAQKQQGIMRQEDLSKMLLTMGVADIYVVGFASGKEGALQCTFNATTADGIIIGVSTFDGPVRDYRAVARHIFGELTLGMMRSWRPPAQITVHLLGIADLAEFDALRKAINQFGGAQLRTTGSEKFDKSSGEGIVEFYLEYKDLLSSELVERLKDIKNQANVPLPQFTAESKTDELLQFRVRPAVVPPTGPKMGG